MIAQVKRGKTRQKILWHVVFIKDLVALDPPVDLAINKIVAKDGSCSALRIFWE